jgi:hypothetical protein
MAFKYNIKPNTVDSHQVSPGYVLTFLRFSNRDTKNYPNIAEPLDIRRPLVVISDAVRISVNKSKNSHLSSASFVLKGGDINYSTAVAPGDFVFVNMVDTEAQVLDIYNRAIALQPINKFKDGFKGIYRVQSVRRVLQNNREGGMKDVTYQIQCVGFTEFNQVIYFNQYLYNPEERNGDEFRLLASAAQEFNSQQKEELFTNLSNVFRRLVEFTIGAGFPKDFAGNKDGLTRNHNRNFEIPGDVGRLLGIGQTSRAADMYQYYIGVEQYSAAKTGVTNPETGLNPRISSRAGNFRFTGPELSGTAFLKGEYWNQTTAWSILQQYSNSLINEMYTTYKVSPEGYVLPSVVFRQKPFTSDQAGKNFPELNIFPTTKFSSLPRWKLDPAMVYEANLGRDEAGRINFVQVIGQSLNVDAPGHIAFQSAMQNFQLDPNDIKRHGLKPYIATSNFDYRLDANKTSFAPIWSQLTFDWVNQLNLKENGTFQCTGLEYPISVGDNLEFENTVYHIENITHEMVVNPNGPKAFYTTVQVSYGVDVRSNAVNPIYTEMQYTDTATYRKDNWDNSGKTLPGFSDSQDIPSRPTNPDQDNTKEQPFGPPLRKVPKDI